MSHDEHSGWHSCAHPTFVLTGWSIVMTPAVTGRFDPQSVQRARLERQSGRVVTGYDVGMTSGSLGPAVDQFVDAISDELAALSGEPAASFVAEAAVEASNIVGRRDRCRRSLHAERARRVPRCARATGSTRPLRHLRRPSFASRTCCSGQDRATSLSAQRDVRPAGPRRRQQRGTRRSHRYYELALRLAHVTAALDLVPSPDEIDAIDEVPQSRMLDHLDSMGVAAPRPTGAVPAARSVSPAADGPMPAGPASHHRSRRHRSGRRRSSCLPPARSSTCSPSSTTWSACRT